jgi:D-sedoheptulose 7-phosphate isomerase
MQFIAEYLDDLKQTIARLDYQSIETAIRWLKQARDGHRMIFVCGNGGSASIASQMVGDVLKGASYGMPDRFRIVGLADSISTITAYANDVGYEHVFSEQLRNFAQNGDVLIAISGSGSSNNVLNAVEYANSIGCKTIALTQAGGGRLKDMAQLTLAVPNTHMGRLEDCFFIMTHVLAYAFIENVADSSIFTSA